MDKSMPENFGTNNANSECSILTQRDLQLQGWLDDILPKSIRCILPLQGDASFRRYFRVLVDGGSYVAMDAPPDYVSCTPFVRINQSLRRQGVCAPEIHYEDINRGFLLLSDFGDCLYLDKLNRQTADGMYRSAFESLLLVQGCNSFGDYRLPAFTRDIYRMELGLWLDWYLAKYKKVVLGETDAALLASLFDQLIKVAMEQPQIFVHRDYHSRNLMVFNDRVGVLDFQDAAFGPVTYDLVSLLRDCYIDWPEEKVLHCLR